MDQNPYLENLERASELLRLTLALLSKHKIPVSPLNYRLGYDCAAGNNEVLKNALEDIASQPGRLQSEHLWSAYQSAYLLNDAVLEKFRWELKRVIESIQQGFVSTGSALSSYAESLDSFVNTLNTMPFPDAMRAEAIKVINGTRLAAQVHGQFESQITHMAREIGSLRLELAQAREESMTDSLTEIHNRKAFDNAMVININAAREQREAFCVLICDIDYFKKVNDTHGHVIGDKILKYIAATIKKCIKGTDMVARYGGEEFGIILPNTELHGAVTVAEQIRQAVSRGALKDTISKKIYERVTISIGVSQFKTGDDVSDVLGRSDKALYAAKEHGRNRVEFAA